MHAAPQWAAADGRPRWQVADVFHLYGDDYRNRHPLPAAHRKVMHAIEVCRTEALGGHLERCNSCGFERSLFHSCRNRHCPRCGSSATHEWVEAQKAELLPVGYFHLVFTVPHELNPLILTNKKVLFNILFKAVSETLADFGRTHLKGKIGFLAVLHTWDQTLLDHFHLHCLIPGGALAFDRSRWIPARSNFLFHVHALSIVFRAKFLDLLDDARSKNQLQFLGRAETLAAAIGWNQLHDSLKCKKWVVYAKRPFSSPETVLEYLGRYTHRVAISNHRIQSVADAKVTFLYRGRKADTSRCAMTLDATEFIRRFLLHVLPDGFQRVRHFGLLANRWKKVQLERCFRLLQVSAPARSEAALLDPTTPTTCPACRSGLMIAVGTLLPAFLDSS